MDNFKIKRFGINSLLRSYGFASVISQTALAMVLFGLFFVIAILFNFQNYLNTTSEGISGLFLSELFSTIATSLLMLIPVGFFAFAYNWIVESKNESRFQIEFTLDKLMGNLEEKNWTIIRKIKIYGMSMFSGLIAGLVTGVISIFVIFVSIIYLIYFGPTYKFNQTDLATLLIILIVPFLIFVIVTILTAIVIQVMNVSLSVIGGIKLLVGVDEANDLEKNSKLKWIKLYALDNFDYGKYTAVTGAIMLILISIVFLSFGLVYSLLNPNSQMLGGSTVIISLTVISFIVVGLILMVIIVGFFSGYLTATTFNYASNDGLIDGLHLKIEFPENYLKLNGKNTIEPVIKKGCKQ